MSASPRVLVFSSQERKLSSLSPFQRREGCDRMGKVLRCDKLRDGSIEVEFASATDAARALDATAFTYTVREGGDRRETSISMIVAPHRTKNSCRGIINCFDLKDVSDDDVADGLSQFGVTHARRITSRRRGVAIPTNSIVLTFNGNDLPSDVVVGYVRVKVRAYIPSPMRCFHCQRFGHPRTRCDGQRTCSKCASLDHTDETCQSEDPWCVNCGEGQIPHPSYDPSCPKYVEEKEINAIKATRNISFREARELYQESHPRTSYAQKVKAPPSKSISPDQMTVAQLMSLLKSFGLTVVASGAEPERATPSASLGSATQAPQTSQSASTVTAPASSSGAGDGWTLVPSRRKNDRRSPPRIQAAGTPALPRPPPAVDEALRRGEDERRAREAKRARLAQKAREAKRSPTAESASAGSSSGTSATPETPKARNPPEMGPPPPPPPPPPPQRRPPPPLPAATPVARPPPAASAELRPPQAPFAPGRPPKRPLTGSPNERQKSKPRPDSQPGPGNPRSHSADGRVHREASGHPRIHFGESASSDGEELV